MLYKIIEYDNLNIKYCHISLWMDFILFGVVVNVMNGQRYEWILSSLG